MWFQPEWRGAALVSHLSKGFEGYDVVGRRVSLHEARLRQGQYTLDRLLGKGVKDGRGRH